MFEFNVEISGLGQIMQEYAKEEEEIKQRINRGLSDLEGDMRAMLGYTLQEIWYEGYKPKAYLRRTDDSSLGIAITRDENVESTVKGTQLLFEYNPTGEHEVPEWSERNGDELIEWIQTKHFYGGGTDEEKFENKNAQIPARPFWNIFVDRVKNELAMSSIKASLGKDYVLIADGNDFLLDGNEKL